MGGAPGPTYRGQFVGQGTISGPRPRDARDRCDAGRHHTGDQNDQARHQDIRRGAGTRGGQADGNDGIGSVQNPARIPQMIEQNQDEGKGHGTIDGDGQDHRPWHGMSRFAHFFGHVYDAVETCGQLSVLPWGYSLSGSIYGWISTYR